MSGLVTLRSSVLSVTCPIRVSSGPPPVSPTTCAARWWRFRPRHGSVCRTSRPSASLSPGGVFPGTPLADLLFAFIFARFQRGVLEQLREADLVPRIGMSGQGFWASGGEIEEVEIAPHSFMNDLFLPLCDKSPAILLDKVKTAGQIVKAEAARFASSTNNKVGKTEAFIDLRGRQAREVRSDMCRNREDDGTPFIKLACGERLRVVRRYKNPWRQGRSDPELE